MSISVGQHRLFVYRDKPPKVVAAGAYRGGSLDKALTGFARDGVRVLGFWRSGGNWVFKTMEPR